MMFNNARRQNTLRNTGKAKAMKKVKVKGFGFRCYRMFSALNALLNIYVLKIRCTLTIQVLLMDIFPIPMF